MRLVSYWYSDIETIKNTITRISLDLERIKINPLIKKEILRDLNTIMLKINKGKFHNIKNKNEDTQ